MLSFQKIYPLEVWGGEALICGSVFPLCFLMIHNFMFRFNPGLSVYCLNYQEPLNFKQSPENFFFSLQLSNPQQALA